MLTTDSSVKNSLVACESNQGIEIRGSLMRLTRYLVAFEVYNNSNALRLSEVLGHFRIIFQDRTIYSGRAVIGNLVGTGLTTVCEASLDEGSWLDVEFHPDMASNGSLRSEFAGFVQEWQKLYHVAADYKLIIADMQSFFSDLRLWLDQIELGIRAAPSGDRLRLEQHVAEELAGPIVDMVNELFERFELVAQGLRDEELPAHRSYMRRQLHPWVMCAPFAYRTFHKPLGYAGDYEMVNMIVRNAYEGSSLFAKLVNTWFLRQAPAVAHRNRVAYLSEKLLHETLRATRAGRQVRVLDVGCGPAQAIQKFMAEQPISAQARFTLLDFNEETLRHAQNALGEVRTNHGRATALQFVKRSVHQILKEGGRSIERGAQEQYDVISCAGLFDYLTSAVCQRLMNIMYEWLAPGGLLIGTNVEPGNPLRHGMEHLLDWHLIYRTSSQLRALAPRQAPPDSASVVSDHTGVNVFLEVRKPDHG